MSTHENLRKEFVNSTLDDTFNRVNSLVETAKHPRPLHLGILLALHIAKEIQAGKAPGTDSAKLVLAWTETHGAEVVDEAVVFARQFLLKPQILMEQIVNNLDSGKDAGQEQSDVAAILEEDED